MQMPHRLAIVVSHPVQYTAPWFVFLAAQLKLKVFYLWDFGVKETRDRVFGTSFVWDIPMLDGYESVFLLNRSSDPGTHHFRGLDNPDAVDAIASWNPDALLIYGYTYKTHIELLLSPRLKKIPMLFRGDSHDLCRGGGFKVSMSREIRSLLFRRFSGFLSVGKANTEYFRHSRVPDSKIFQVPHCVDNERFQSAGLQAEAEAGAWKQELGIASGATVVLFVGKLEKIKRPLDLLEAFLTLEKCSVERWEECELVDCGLHDLSIRNSQLTPPVLLFVGSGPLEETLRERAGKELGTSVFFGPFQNQSQMPKVYATGNLLVLPSQSETWGLVVNEAMCLGLPTIVSSSVGCGPDLVIPGETGWVFPAGDIEALRRTLSETLYNPARLKGMGGHARRHIASFSYDHATASLLKVLKHLTADS